MKIVIIEDELYAARRLENMIRLYDRDIQIIAWLESVKDSIKWFSEHNEYDLIFLDIHLEDNLSFGIFDKVAVRGPVIFTTATDEVAIKAFVTKGIDFLHKPIAQAELFGLLEKYKDPDEKFHYVIDSEFFSELVKTNK